MMLTRQEEVLEKAVMKREEENEKGEEDNDAMME